MRRRTGAVGLMLATVVGVTACSSPTTSGGSDALLPGTTSATIADLAGTFPVAGRKVYLECHGTGSPTIVLQSGYGNGGDIWNATEAKTPTVAKGLAATNRVCVYDRPGSTLSVDPNGTPLTTPAPARSDQVPQPRTSTAVVTEWHDLLAAAKVPGPYVIVGHSIGGLFALIYARSYPDQVAGLVAVDATPPAILGLLTPSTRTVFTAGLKGQSPIPGYALEQYDLDEVLSTLQAAPALTPMPTTLMFAGKQQQVSDPQMQELVKEIAQVQDQARAEFAASIPGVTTVTVPDATHYIQVDRPDAVIDAVNAVAAKT